MILQRDRLDDTQDVQGKLELDIARMSHLQKPRGADSIIVNATPGSNGSIDYVLQYGSMGKDDIFAPIGESKSYDTKSLVEELVFHDLLISGGIRDLDDYIRVMKYRDAVALKVAPEIEKISDSEVEVPFKKIVKHAGKIRLPETDCFAFYNEKAEAEDKNAGIDDKYSGVLIADLSRPATFSKALRAAADRITYDKETLKMLRNAIYDKGDLVNFGIANIIKQAYNDVVKSKFNENTTQEQKTFLLKYLALLFQNAQKTLDFISNGDCKISGEHIARIFEVFSQNNDVAESMYVTDAAAMYMLATQTKDDEQLRQAVAEGIGNSTLGKLALVGQEYRTVNKAIRKSVPEPDPKYVAAIVDSPENADERAVGYFARILQNYSGSPGFEQVEGKMRDAMESLALKQYMRRDPWALAKLPETIPTIDVQEMLKAG